jgi:hypothetical protein
MVRKMIPISDPVLEAMNREADRHEPFVGKGANGRRRFGRPAAAQKE